MQEVINFLYFLVLKRKSLPWFAHRDTLCCVLPYFWCWTDWYNSASFRGEKLVAQATKSELLLPAPICVAVMAVENFRRFSFNSDHSCSNVEYSFLLFFIKKRRKKPHLVMLMHISFLFLRLHTCHGKHLASVQCHCSESKFDFETVLMKYIQSSISKCTYSLKNRYVFVIARTVKLQIMSHLYQFPLNVSKESKIKGMLKAGEGVCMLSPCKARQVKFRLLNDIFSKMQHVHARSLFWVSDTNVIGFGIKWWTHMGAM